MPTKKNLTSEELDAQITKLVDRRALMVKRAAELEMAILAIDKRLKGFYAKRTIALNFTLPLGD